MSEVKRFPWGEGDPDPNQVYFLKLEDIKIPEPRVTSVFTEEQKGEFLQSLKVEGQKDPIKCILVKGQLWLEDGLNRILGLHELRVPGIKGLVRKGTLGDVQIGNIITARHRGRENPAQTAEVIRDLVDNEGMDKAIVMQRLGLSSSWFGKLYRIAHLPDEVKDHIKYGRLSASVAYHLCVMEDPVQASSIASQAVQWGYNEDQVKAAVMQAINPDYDPAPEGFTFGTGGQPQTVYPHCLTCDLELKENPRYVWICPACLQAVQAGFAEHRAQVQAAGHAGQEGPAT